MLLNKTLIISSFLFQAGLFGGLFALVCIRLLTLGWQCSAERWAGWDSFSPSYPCQTSKASASEKLAESTVLSVCLWLLLPPVAH